MKIGVFTYNFPHYKSQQGLLNLVLGGNKPDVIFAQDKKKLNISKSNIRVYPRYNYLWNPCKMASRLGICVMKDDHDSDNINNSIKDMNLDLGIILGARILKQHTINCFNLGVLNMHPGIIPINRGLDNLKWAILDNIKQGVTSHLIDGRVDMGYIIDMQTIQVYLDDTLIDISIRLQEKEQQMMLEAIDYLKLGNKPKLVIEKGKHNTSVSVEKEIELLNKFEYYKHYYDSMGVI